MTDLEVLKEKIINGYEITKKEAVKILEEPIDELTRAADEIRKSKKGNQFELCSIINGKSGRCTENCKFCAQSVHNKTEVESYNLLNSEELLQEAEKLIKSGISRYSIVTSGRRLSDNEIEQLCISIKKIKEHVDIHICVSAGLLQKKDFLKLKQAGVERIHNNLETSKNYFKNVCSTHTYENKMNSIEEAFKAGLEVCSGGLFGIGETMEDRIDMALDLRKAGVKFVPVNFLNPIQGTPFESFKSLTLEEKRKIVALFRFIIPNASIRMAGGRILLKDRGKACFLGGANAAITGDLLTTTGSTIKEDKKIINDIGYFL